MTEQDKPELLPCPFCGGEARLWPVIMPFDADCDAITVQCGECDVIGADILVDQDVHGQSDLPGLEADAIAAWNTRATPAQPDAPALVEELQAQIAHIEQTLKDPVAVHVNMLRGGIAIPSLTNLAHASTDIAAFVSGAAALVEAVRGAAKNAEVWRVGVLLHATDWMAMMDALSAWEQSNG